MRYGTNIGVAQFEKQYKNKCCKATSLLFYFYASERVFSLFFIIFIFISMLKRQYCLCFLPE